MAHDLLVADKEYVMIGRSVQEKLQAACRAREVST
jgi:hypothetical protein